MRNCELWIPKYQKLGWQCEMLNDTMEIVQCELLNETTKLEIGIDELQKVDYILGKWIESENENGNSD